MAAFRDDDDYLISNKSFEVVYPNEYSEAVLDAQKVLISTDERDEIVDDIFEHPLLDLMPIFDHVRNTNLPLSSNDIEAVKSLVKECKREITAFHTKIEGLIPSVLAMIRELAETSSHLIRQKRQIRLGEFILSRPKHLPQDVLEQVFLTCWQMQDFTARLTRTGVPLQLAGVSHRWRAIALGMPILWSNIRIESASSIPRAIAWFNRCRTTPFLTLNVSRGHITPSQLDKLFEFIKTSSIPIRLRKLDLEIPQANLAKKVWDTLLGGSASEGLEELVILDSHQPDPIPKSVRRLYMHNPPASWVYSHPPSGLTVLCVTMKDVSIHWRMVESILFHCPKLERVTLRTIQSGLQPECPNRLGSLIAPTILENLVYLGISNDCDEVDLPNDFLGSFHFPNLWVFQYRVKPGGFSRPAWLISHPLLAHIHHLTLQIDPEVSLETFRSILWPASSLEELSIFCDDTSLQNLFQLLSNPSSTTSSSLLPSLKSLYLGGWGQSRTKVHTPALVEFLRAWSPSIRGDEHCLTHLTFRAWYNIYDIPIQLNIGHEIREANPFLKIRAIRSAKTSWLVNMPLMFMTYPLPFNREDEPGEVMDGEDEGKWKVKTGQIYRIV
ncbi:hypothetical protein BDN72DRAFT_962072 [Pluteus cervinus]|uniref:Uncharacterized protein n=1 Tax=Pluteus cervinus TaxID=181527 RepID=A0ACD3AJW0_9AGAR|nr:hypothetical protein BDN72DRAFT_962072 [Pluteus cervinus]